MKGYSELAGAIGKGLDTFLEYLKELRRKRTREEYERTLQEIDADAIGWMCVAFGLRDKQRLSPTAGETNSPSDIARKRVTLNQTQARELARYIASLEHGYDLQ